MLPGTVQQPRPPFFIAGNGERGMRLAANTRRLGHVGRSANESESCFDVVSSQMVRLDEILSTMEETQRSWTRSS